MIPISKETRKVIFKNTSSVLLFLCLCLFLPLGQGFFEIIRDFGILPIGIFLVIVTIYSCIFDLTQEYKYKSTKIKSLHHIPYYFNQEEQGD